MTTLKVVEGSLRSLCQEAMRDAVEKINAVGRQHLSDRMS
jgi:hypothetical protein